MDSNKVSDLFKNHPLLYSSLKNVRCRDGWFRIIWDLSQSLEPLIQEQICSSDEYKPGSFGAVQVKEKFGGLRFYMSEATEDMRNLIRSAERRSFKTCEMCGSPGEVRSGNWIRTLCDECFN